MSVFSPSSTHAVALAPRRGAEGRDVAAGLGLGEGEGADALAGEHAGQDARAAAPRCPARTIGYEPRPCTAKMASASGETWPSASRTRTSERTSTWSAAPARRGAAVRLGHEVRVEAERAHRARRARGVVLGGERGERVGREARGERRVGRAEEGGEVVAGEGDRGGSSAVDLRGSQSSAPAKTAGAWPCPRRTPCGSRGAPCRWPAPAPRPRWPGRASCRARSPASASSSCGRRRGRGRGARPSACAAGTTSRVGDDAVGEADAVRLGRVDEVAEEEQLGGAAVARRCAGRRNEAPMSAPERPTLGKMKPKRALSAAMRRSQAAAMTAPAPTAMPLTAAMTGRRQLADRSG